MCKAAAFGSVGGVVVVVLFSSSVVTRATPVFFCPRTKGRVHPCAFRAAPLRVSLLPPGTPLSTASARVYARVSHPPAPPPRKFTAVLEQSYDDRRAFLPTPHSAPCNPDHASTIISCSKHDPPHPPVLISAIVVWCPSRAQRRTAMPF